MDDKLKTLLTSGKINHREYDMFLVFELSEIGRNYLKNAMEFEFLETPSNPIDQLFAFYDGRKSVYREIKQTIYKIYHEMTLLKNE